MFSDSTLCLGASGPRALDMPEHQTCGAGKQALDHNHDRCQMQTCSMHACARPHQGYTQANAAQWASAHRDFIVARDFPSTTSASGHSSCHSHHSDKPTDMQQTSSSDTTLQPLQPSTGQTPQPPYHMKQAPAHALWTLIHSSFAPSAKLLPKWGTGVTPEAAASIPPAHENAHRLARHLAAQLRSAAQQECGGADVVVHIDLPASNTLVSNNLIYLVPNRSSWS